MAYNWAREEEWRRWKEAEEKQLRELGVSEAFIKDLHAYDWDMFNADRRYYDHLQETGSYLDALFAVEDQKEIRTVKDLLEEIDDPELAKILSETDQLTLEILLLRIQGNEFSEIAKMKDMKRNAVIMRVVRLRKKLKKFDR